MANTVFSKNLRKLREEKKISQKSAAASLGISQALLSHYEKGIRECGLDFLTRAAKFYGVSSDCLLGIAERCRDAAPEADIHKINDNILKKDGKEYNISAALYKNLLINAITYIFDGMKEPARKEISVWAGKYISMSVYTLCAVLYGGIAKNPLGDYDSENAYLNNIINNISISFDS
jgi:transcriptional regulator with XRE-family HTH domain